MSDNKVFKGYKVQMCKFWSPHDHSLCANGENCNYAHGEKELRRHRDEHYDVNSSRSKEHSQEHSFSLPESKRRKLNKDEGKKPLNFEDHYEKVEGKICKQCKILKDEGVVIKHENRKMIEALWTVYENYEEFKNKKEDFLNSVSQIEVILNKKFTKSTH